MALRPDKREFGSLKKYTLFLRKNFKRTRLMRPGNFYSYIYDFDRHQKYEKIKYWDLQPLIFFFSPLEGHRGLIQGINFHHLPIIARKIYMARLKKLVNEDFPKNRRLFRLNEYHKLYILYKKATKFAIRNYDTSKMRSIRQIPNSEIENVLQYYARTYYGITISRVEARYLAFRI